MPDIGVRELQSSLTQVLDQVEAGAEYRITRRGKAIARLEPIEREEVELTDMDTNEERVIEALRQKYGGNVKAMRQALNRLMRTLTRAADRIEEEQEESGHDD